MDRKARVRVHLLSLPLGGRALCSPSVRLFKNPSRGGKVELMSASNRQVLEELGPQLVVIPRVETSKDKIILLLVFFFLFLGFELKALSLVEKHSTT
jgi:hypothetical protein